MCLWKFEKELDSIMFAGRLFHYIHLLWSRPPQCSSLQPTTGWISLKPPTSDWLNIHFAWLYIVISQEWLAFLGWATHYHSSDQMSLYQHPRTLIYLGDQVAIPLLTMMEFNMLKYKKYKKLFRAGIGICVLYENGNISIEWQRKLGNTSLLPLVSYVFNTIRLLKYRIEGKFGRRESLANWLFLSIWQKKVWWINRSPNRLLIVSNNLGGFSQVSYPCKVLLETPFLVWQWLHHCLLFVVPVVFPPPVLSTVVGVTYVMALSVLLVKD